jgi:hypothetical protein
MCHECGDDEGDEIEFASDYVEALQSMPPDVREEMISEVAGYMNHVMQRAEQQGILFELITQWDRRRVAMYEAAIVMEKNILDDGNN